MKLLIVESPAKAKTISKYLDDLPGGKKGEYTVKASIGHVRDLPKSNNKAIDIEKGFKPHYVIPQKKKKVISELKRASKKADEVVLATDPDREGEAIAWHVAQALGLNPDDEKVRRIAFNEITKEAVQEAIKHPRGIDKNLLRSQEARRVLDRLFGYDLSGLIWKKVRYGLSAGRVQSPALRILMEREREIRDFEPEIFWVITADLKHENDTVEFTCSEEPRDRERVDSILSLGKSGTWSVAAIEEKKIHRQPRAPFKTSTLQAAANSRFGFTPARTMRAAQKLYETGAITYMRTDSTNMAASAQKQMLAIIESEFGKKYVRKKRYATKSKVAQEAHEAIRPTNPGRTSPGGGKDEKRLYNLIRRRAIASQMQPAHILRTKITAHTGDDDMPDFTVNGSRTLFDGWFAMDPHARRDDVELPEMQKSDSLELVAIEDEEKQTQPPKRYSEAGLVKELEKRGIGRPSTYASIISILEERSYVEKINRSLKPTDMGEVVSEFLEKNFADYISDSFTAEMEDELDEIAEGKREYVETLKDFYDPFRKAVEKKEDIPKLTTLGDAPEDIKCPRCGAPMIVKLSKNGKFYSCSRFPDCHGARTIEGREIKDDDPIGADPETGKNIYVLEGPYGPYVQLGEKNEKKKPKRASIPADKNPEDITVEEALRLLSLPRTLGKHPETGNEIQANIGRFGPYVAEMKKPKPDYRSLKDDDPYTITLERALDILKKPKKRRGSGRKP